MILLKNIMYGKIAISRSLDGYLTFLQKHQHNQVIIDFLTSRSPQVAGVTQQLVANQTDVFENSLKDYLRLVAAARVRSFFLNQNIDFFLISFSPFSSPFSLPIAYKPKDFTIDIHRPIFDYYIFYSQFARKFWIIAKM